MSIVNVLLHPYIYFYKFKFFLLKYKFKLCGKDVNMSYKFNVREPQNISLGNNINFGHNSVISCYEKRLNKNTGYKPELFIGDNVTFGCHTTISCLNKIVINSGVLTGDNVSIIDNYHGSIIADEYKTLPVNRTLYSKGPIVIGKNVWIGKNVCIMPNVTIGDYAIIGANSVVTHDIPEKTVAAGCPARVIKNLG